MRVRVAIAVAAMAVRGVTLTGQHGKHLNPMINLLEAGKPVFGLGMPSARGGGGGGNRGRAGGDQAGAAAAATTPPPAAPAAPPKTPVELAKDAIAHSEADYFFSGGM